MKDLLGNSSLWWRTCAHGTHFVSKTIYWTGSQSTLPPRRRRGAVLVSNKDLALPTWTDSLDPNAKAKVKVRAMESSLEALEEKQRYMKKLKIVRKFSKWALGGRQFNVFYFASLLQILISTTSRYQSMNLESPRQFLVMPSVKCVTIWSKPILLFHSDENCVRFRRPRVKNSCLP